MTRMTTRTQAARKANFDRLVPEMVIDLEFNPAHQFMLVQEDRFGDEFYTTHKNGQEVCQYAADNYDDFPKFKVINLDTGKRVPGEVTITVELEQEG